MILNYGSLVSDKMEMDHAHLHLSRSRIYYEEVRRLVKKLKREKEF